MSKPDPTIKNLSEMYAHDELNLAYYYSTLAGAVEFVNIQLSESDEVYTSDDIMESVIQFALVQLEQQDAIEESEVYQDLVKVYTTYFQ